MKTCTRDCPKHVCQARQSDVHRCTESRRSDLCSTYPATSSSYFHKLVEFCSIGKMPRNTPALAGLLLQSCQGLLHPVLVKQHALHSCQRSFDQTCCLRTRPLHAHLPRGAAAGCSVRPVVAQTPTVAAVRAYGTESQPGGTLSGPAGSHGRT